MYNTTKEILKIFGDNEVHNVNDIVKTIKINNPEIQDDSTRRAIQRLRINNNIYKVSKQNYCIGSKHIFKPQLETSIKKINRDLKKKYPDVEYLVWDTSWLNNMSHNLYSFTTTIIEVEKDLEETIFHYIAANNNKKKVFVNPTDKEYNTYITGEDTIVIKTLLKRSPKTSTNKIKIPKLEKIIVDTYVENSAFNWMQGTEWNKFIQNIMDYYEIDLTTIMNYAKYRNQEDELVNKLYDVISKESCYWRVLDVYKRELSKRMASGESKGK